MRSVEERYGWSVLYVFGREMVAEMVVVMMMITVTSDLAKVLSLQGGRERRRHSLLDMLFLVPRSHHPWRTPF